MTKKDCDIIWSKKIKEKGYCAFCGISYNLEAHHIISRKNNSTRHLLKNGICLCKFHHWQIHNTSKLSDWLNNNYEISYLIQLKYKYFKPDYDIIYNQLKSHTFIDEI
jgi:predicted restriction endonuclease